MTFRTSWSSFCEIAGRATRTSVAAAVPSTRARFRDCFVIIVTQYYGLLQGFQKFDEGAFVVGAQRDAVQMAAVAQWPRGSHASRCVSSCAMNYASLAMVRGSER